MGQMGPTARVLPRTVSENELRMRVAMSGFAAMFVASVTIGTVSAQSTITADRDRATIYRLTVQAIVDQHRDDKRLQPIVAEETVKLPARMIDDVPSAKSYVGQAAIDNWIREGSVEHSIEGAFKGSRGVTVVRSFPPCDAVCLGGNGPPRIYISPVGVNTDHTKAFVWASYVCGSLCGNSHLVILEKVNGIWRVARSSILGQY